MWLRAISPRHSRPPYVRDGSPMPLNRAEELAHRLCTKTFLSLWSVPNPSVRPGKELCDILIVCDPDILLWSVKEIDVADGESAAALERWRRKAIDASAKQLYGAERQLARLTSVPVPGGRYSLPLPAVKERRVHRLAVALGSKGLVPMGEGDLGKGFVHVMDEISLETLLTELDTVVDFIDYLRSKEAFLNKTQVLLAGGEEDLLGIYLHRGRVFPQDPSLLVVQPGVWDEVTRKPEWTARKEADRASYVWDRLIETFLRDFAEGVLVTGQSVEEVDGIMRVMAREHRFARRMLATAFLEFMDLARSEKTRSRIVRSPSGVVYVFLAASRTLDREHRRAELAARCWVARGLNSDSTTAIGIATERYEGKPGFSFDALRLTKEQWNAEDEAQKVYLQNEVGYFREMNQTATREEEFPAPKADPHA